MWISGYLMKSLEWQSYTHVDKLLMVCITFKHYPHIPLYILKQRNQFLTTKFNFLAHFLFLSLQACNLLYNSNNLLLTNLFLQIFHFLFENAIRFNIISNFFMCMNYCCMIAATKFFPNFW